MKTLILIICLTISSCAVVPRDFQRIKLDIPTEDLEKTYKPWSEVNFCLDMKTGKVRNTVGTVTVIPFLAGFGTKQPRCYANEAVMHTHPLFAEGKPNPIDFRAWRKIQRYTATQTDIDSLYFGVYKRYPIESLTVYEYIGGAK